ncbi:unnamed protein product [Pleuronectes platessa]|uniref:Uncharacterized protein n=1 Tax=Pleuronectes platessa TaxID=8262 RepID=A0A9N7TKE9_PLEPL|nr:unnamed protein product [Pleuronectes platessa]
MSSFHNANSRYTAGHYHLQHLTWPHQHLHEATTCEAMPAIPTKVDAALLSGGAHRSRLPSLEPKTQRGGALNGESSCSRNPLPHHEKPTITPHKTKPSAYRIEI